MKKPSEEGLSMFQQTVEVVKGLGIHRRIIAAEQVHQGSYQFRAVVVDKLQQQLVFKCFHGGEGLIKMARVQHLFPGLPQPIREYLPTP
jgi:hypothetical protein